MIAIVVTSCKDCTFCQGSGMYERMECSAADCRPLGEEAPKTPPDWCPLREVDHLVTLRAK